MYSVIRLWTNRNRLLASSRKSGKLEIKDIGPARYVAYQLENGVWREREFQDYETRRRTIEGNEDLYFEGDVSPVKRFLADNDVVLEVPRRVYLDLETDSRVPPKDQVPRPDYIPPRARILSWALVDEEGYEEVDVLEDDTDDDEFDLLIRLWKRMAAYDQVAAWSGDAFDFPVLQHRSRQLLNRESLFWDNQRRLLFVDHLACFKRHHMAPESGDDKTSLKLGDVCASIIGDTKDEFNARRTWEAWVAGGEERSRMARYNLQDTRLLRKLEEATGYLELQQTIAEVTLTPADSHGLKPMAQFDQFLLKLAHQRGTHLPTKKRPTGMEEQYEGAYVLKPTKLGVHRMVHVCDFKSLYPTVIRSLNISPETKGLLGCTAFGTEVDFGCDEEGMVPFAMRTLMGKRDEWKKKAKANPDDKYAERMNKAYKIVCNSGYGVLGSAWSRFYDVAIAESITLGAQALIRATKTAAEERGWEVIYIDTDSLFVVGCTVGEFKSFVEWCNRELYPRMLSERGVPAPQNCIELDYEKCFERLIFPLGDDGPSAKRYAGSYNHYAFKPKTKPEIRGLEYMRGDGVRLGRHTQKDCIDRILAGATALEMEAWVVEQRDRVTNEDLPAEDIMISKGLGRDLDSYSVKSRNTAHIRLARELEKRGEDVGQGSKIAYVIVDGTKSPTEIAWVEEWDGIFDRHHCWNKQVYPGLFRVLAGAFPGERNWKRWFAKRPKKALPGQLTLGMSH